MVNSFELNEKKAVRVKQQKNMDEENRKWG
jgi:hypothetical protein